MAETKEKEKTHSCKCTFQQNFTPKAIVLTNEDHADKMETTNLIQALDEYTHKKHSLVTGLPNHQSTPTFTTSLPTWFLRSPGDTSYICHPISTSYQV